MNTKLHSFSDYQAVVSSMLLPLEKYCSSDSSGTILPNEIQTTYSMKEARLEAFSRTLLGASLIDNTVETCESFFRKIKEGTNPNSHQYWGKIQDCSQTIVEMFPILLFCLRNIVNFKQSFSEEETKNFEHWFLQINNVKVCDNNWHFFPILVNIFLKRLGFQHSTIIVDREWERIDEFYLGNGWYSDGKTEQRDYYIAYSFHFYSLLFALYSDNNSRKDIIIERAHLFAKSFYHFFSEFGPSIPFGRSLTYKFAHVAFWSLYSLFIDDSNELGVIKGIINRNIRWWLSNEIFDENGVLINGYAYANPYMLEQYNGAGSPYWAFKAFFCLLNVKSTYFLAEEKTLPSLEKSITIPEAYITIHHSNGHPFAFINGQSNNWFCQKTAKYEKFVYSSLFGFCIHRSHETLEMLSPDNTLVAKIGNTLFVKNNSTTIFNDDKVQISDWSPISSVVIRSYVFTGAPWHTRIHYIVSNESITLYDCGYAVSPSETSISDIKVHNSTKGTIICVPNSNILYKQVSIPYATRTFNRGTNIFFSAFYGNCTTDGYETSPDLNCIFTKDNQLYAFDTNYPLPSLNLSTIWCHRLLHLIDAFKYNVIKTKKYAVTLLHKNNNI